MRLLFIVVAMSLCACGGPAAPATPADAPAEAVAADPVQLASFDAVWQTVADRHWDLSGVDWQAVRDELRPRAMRATSADELRPILEEMLGRLEQSHFGIVPGAAYAALEGESAAASDGAVASADTSADTAAATNDSADGAAATNDTAAATADDDTNADGGGTVGLDLRVLDGQAVVTRVVPGSAASEAGVGPGWIVVAVGGDPVAEALAKVSEAYPEGTSTRGLFLARAVLARLGGAVGSKVAVSFVDGHDHEVVRELERREPTGKLVTFGHMPSLHMRYEARRLGDDAGYVALSAFFDPPSVMQSFADDIARFREAKLAGMVLDLRGNPGGLGFMAVGMGSWLVRDAKQSLGTMISKEGELEFALNPQPGAYAGKVAVLVDSHSGSTSEILAGGLQAIGRARVFGTRTAGAALPSMFERLPNGDGFQYATANYVSADGHVLEGQGVIPDESAPLTRAALLAGKDPVLDAALRWIRSNDQGTP